MAIVIFPHWSSEADTLKKISIPATQDWLSQVVKSCLKPTSISQTNNILIGRRKKRKRKIQDLGDCDRIPALNIYTSCCQISVIDYFIILLYIQAINFASLTTRSFSRPCPEDSLSTNFSPPCLPPQWGQRGETSREGSSHPLLHSRP